MAETSGVAGVLSGVVVVEEESGVTGAAAVGASTVGASGVAVESVGVVVVVVVVELSPAGVVDVFVVVSVLCVAAVVSGAAATCG